MSLETKWFIMRLKVICWHMWKLWSPEFWSTSKSYIQASNEASAKLIWLAPPPNVVKLNVDVVTSANAVSQKVSLSWPLHCWSFCHWTSQLLNSKTFITLWCRVILRCALIQLVGNLLGSLGNYFLYVLILKS